MDGGSRAELLWTSVSKTLLRIIVEDSTIQDFNHVFFHNFAEYYPIHLIKHIKNGLICMVNLNPKTGLESIEIEKTIME